MKSVSEIKKRLAEGKAVVITAEQASQLARTKSKSEISKEVDVVTTATFAPMCSSGCFLNFGNLDLPIRMEKIFLNGVPAHGGLAAADTYLGAAAENPDNPGYGGAHVICDLIAGKSVCLEAQGKGTDCYPRKEVKTYFKLEDINQAYLYNPRNAYQNYPVAINRSSKDIYTYMGKLNANLGNASYSSAGEISPLLNDPKMRTIGVGSRVFLAGARGYVSWQGTQYDNQREENEHGIPMVQSATLALIGDMKKMDARFIKPLILKKYGVSLFIGVGIPIPMLDDEIAGNVSIANEQIDTLVRDYAENGHPVVCKTNYAELFSGEIDVLGQKVSTFTFSNLAKAREIAEILKTNLQEGNFQITEPVEFFEDKVVQKPLILREKDER